jgi:hypothetical protein
VAAGLCHERWWLQCAADWPVVHDELCGRLVLLRAECWQLACSAGLCNARSTRHRGQAVGCSFLLLDESQS